MADSGAPRDAGVCHHIAFCSEVDPGSREENAPKQADDSGVGAKRGSDGRAEPAA